MTATLAGRRRRDPKESFRTPAGQGRRRDPRSVSAHLETLVGELVAWSEASRFLVPSFDPRHPSFEPKRYGRGPVWGMVNYMVADGLEQMGEVDWAQRICRDTEELTRISGMLEAWDPIDGGPGGLHFSWTPGSRRLMEVLACVSPNDVPPS